MERMMNRRERIAVRRRLYIAATWAGAEHLYRYGRWAMSQATLGYALNLSAA